MRITPLVEILLMLILTMQFGLLGMALARLVGNMFGLVLALKLARWF